MRIARSGGDDTKAETVGDRGTAPPANRLPWDDDLRVCVSLGALDAALRSVGYKRTTNTGVRIERSWRAGHQNHRPP